MRDNTTDAVRYYFSSKDGRTVWLYRRESGFFAAAHCAQVDEHPRAGASIIATGDPVPSVNGATEDPSQK